MLKGRVDFPQEGAGILHLCSEEPGGVSLTARGKALPQCFGWLVLEVQPKYFSLALLDEFCHIEDSLVPPANSHHKQDEMLR